jgi:Pyridoxamine 5'-phosphate oxidase
MSAKRRTGGHLTWDWVDRRLRSDREIWVATAGPDGRADAVPVWFWWDGDCIYFSTKAGSRKARNLRHEPHVVLHNGDGTSSIEWIATNAQKYVAPESGEAATIFIRGDVVLRVTPYHVLAWSYANVSLRTDWEFD